MGDNGVIKTGGISSPKPTASENVGPIIKESQESAEYQQDLQVVLGTAFGVIAMVGLVALAFLIFRMYRARNVSLSSIQNDDVDIFERDITVGVEGKFQPVILLLYAYDCPVHEQVVDALAAFLMEVCGVTVTLDLLEESEIMERGIDDWLVDRLQEADFILVLCSLGARLRCSKKRVKFKSEDVRALPDYFAVAVDYVAEKMRAEVQKGLSINKFVTAYMEYSTKSDIPPQLERAVQFCLMKDIHKLHIHFNTHGPDSDKSDTASQTSTCESHYHETETGAILKATIEQAKIFFKENPTWLEDRLEISSSNVPVRGHRSRKHRHNQLEEPLLTLVGKPPVIGYSQPQGAITHKHRKSHTYHTIPETNRAFEIPESRHNSTGIFQGRQYSLPSSLASSCLAVPSSRCAISKSMDSFAVDRCFRPDHEGLPCFYCNSTHIDGKPECRQAGHHQEHSSKYNKSQTSLNQPTSDLGPSRSQTVLQAEIHQEWNHPNGGAPDQKSATFAGDPRCWISDHEVPVPYQSLPPHHPPPHLSGLSNSDVLDWDASLGLKKWPTGYPDSPSYGNSDGMKHRLSYRSLSSVSVSTDDSSSLSDGDLLERDLCSIQNISSFHDFVTASSFTNDIFMTFSPSNSSGMEITSVLKPLGSWAKHSKINSGSFSDMNTLPNTDCIENI